MRIKRGLIYPRNSMVNPYTAQGLPQIYKTIMPYCVCMYDFAELTGSNVYDLSGNGNHGTLTAGASGNTSAQQMRDNAKPAGVDGDGINDYITVPTAVRPTGVFTMNIWLKTYSYTNNSYPGIFGGRSLGTSTHKGGVALTHWYYTGGTYRTYLDIYSSTTRYAAVTTTENITNKITMVTGVYDDSYLYLYFNGVQVGSVSVGSITIDWSGATVTRLLSNVQNTTAQYYDGKMHGFFMLHDYAMSVDEIGVLYDIETKSVR